EKKAEKDEAKMVTPQRRERELLQGNHDSRIIRVHPRRPLNSHMATVTKNDEIFVEKLADV
ncbi:MAG: hypothetical protein FWG32_08510, partial [Oscillospiraceae bacterium]|nr:hypothetical protein [Oscillospiraceae bacterium]